MPSSSVVLNSLFWRRADVLHESHYALFEVLEDHGRALAGVDPEAALPIWERVLRCVDRVLPHFHDQRIIYKDILGQIYVKLGRIDDAREAFSSAYEVSKVTRGEKTKATLDLKRLVDNTPEDVDELMFHYSNFEEVFF